MIRTMIPQQVPVVKDKDNKRRRKVLKEAPLFGRTSTLAALS